MPEVRPRTALPSGRGPGPAPQRPGPRGARRVALVLAWLSLGSLAGLAWPLGSLGTRWLHVRWEHPWWLLALVLVPWLLWRGTVTEDRGAPRLRLGTLLGFSAGPAGWRTWLRDLPGVLRAVAVGLLIGAMARPLDVIQPRHGNDEGIDIVLVLDLSGSMQAVMENLPQELAQYVGPRPPGVALNRLDTAKAVIRDFISRRQSDRIGVVVFGKDAYVLSPPTLDYHLLDVLVSSMRLQLIDGGSTAIGDAIGVAVARLRRSKAETKTVILLTDGDNNAGRYSPEYAAELATKVGVKLYTIQIGTGETAKVQDGIDALGQPHFVHYPFPVNPKLLAELADKTGGKTYVATDAKTLRDSFHDVLDSLEKTRFEAATASYDELFDLLLLPGALLLGIEVVLRALLLRRFP